MAHVARPQHHRCDGRLGQDRDDLDVEIKFTAQKSEQTEQLRQMMQGLVAMFELAASLEPDDKDLQQFMELAHDVETSRDGNAIRLSVKLDSDKLMELIEQELH